MRYIKFVFALIITLSAFYSKAQHVGKIDKFEILPGYLEGDKVKIGTGATTTIKYKVTFVREVEATIPKLTWKPFNMTIRLSTPNASGDIILFETAVNVTGADFGSDQVFLRDKEFTATVENSKLNPNRPIILSYIINGAATPVYSYNGKIYYPKIEGTVDPPVNSELSPVYLVIRYDGGNMYKMGTADGVVGENERMGGIAFYVESPAPSTEFYWEYRRDNGSGYPRYSYVYTRGVAMGSEWESTGQIGIRGHRSKVSGTVPVYKISTASGKNIFYTTDYIEGEGTRFKSLGIAFYAFPVPNRTGPIGRSNDGRPKRLTFIDFDINSDQWGLNPEGNLSLNLDQIVADPASIDIKSISFLGDLIPVDPNSPRPSTGTRRENIELPGTYKGNTFSKEIINGSIYIVCKNSSNTAPTEVLNFSLGY